MNIDNILKDIKQNKTFEPDDRVLETVFSAIESDEKGSEETVRQQPKVRILRPAFVIYVIILLLASSFAVTAAVNADVREYLFSIFGGNPNSVEGELIGVTAQSDGVELSIDAVVAEGDSLFMIYTLRDKEHKIFSEATSINSFRATIAGDANYSSISNSVIKDGEKNYMILNNTSIKKGVQQVRFTIESIRTPDPSKEFIIPVGTANYKPEGVDGYIIDSIKLENSRIIVSINITDQSKYTHNFNMRVKNIKTGEFIHAKGESSYSGSEDKSTQIRWYSEKLDNPHSEDYVFMISFDKVYTFEEPLEAAFSVDFNRKPLKTIHPKDAHVLTAVVDKVTVHQMSIIADLTDLAPVKDFSSEKPIPVSDADPMEFLEDPEAPSIPSQKMTVRYNDGTEAAVVSASSHGDNNKYRFYMVLNGSLDYSKEPVLYIGNAKIPLF